MADRFSNTVDRSRRALQGMRVTEWNETPTGTVNGSNATFTLVYTPKPEDALMLFVNGQLQTQGAAADYTLDRNVVTFVAGSVPASGGDVRATYTH